jgi:hypothetical protein
MVDQKSLFDQQDELVASQTNLVLDLIRIYKALGGGWPIEDEDNVSKKTLVSQSNTMQPQKLPFLIDF